MITVNFPTGIKELTVPAVNQWDYGKIIIYLKSKNKANNYVSYINPFTTSSCKNC